MPTLIRTLVVVAVLGGPAAAEVQPPPSPALLTSQVGSYRGVAQDYLVLPGGGELTSSLRFVTARDSLGDAPLRFTDLALFDVSGRWALARPNLEFSADVSLLPKQPSFTSEKPWQSVAFGVRTPLAPRIALGIAGAGGHLIAQQGVWTRQTAHVEWRKPLAPVVNLGLTGGVDVITLSAPKRSSAFVTEVTVGVTTMCHDPSGTFGAWLGIGYALPVAARGQEPGMGRALDPQPRLDFRVGTVVSLARGWDLFAELAVIDRGDLQDPRTQLPILDGGFDQQQVMFGLTRHFAASPVPGEGDPLQVGMAK